jgi:hypothetical protein
MTRSSVNGKGLDGMVVEDKVVGENGREPEEGNAELMDTPCEHCSRTH